MYYINICYLYIIYNNIIRILKMRIVMIAVDNIDYMHIKILYKLIAVNYVNDF